MQYKICYVVCYDVIVPKILVEQMLEYLLCTQMLAYLNILSSFEQFLLLYAYVWCRNLFSMRMLSNAEKQERIILLAILCSGTSFKVLGVSARN